VNGLPITAAHLRELLARLDALGVHTPDGGTVTVALTDDDGTLRATGTLERLRRIAARGCPQHPDIGTGCGCGCGCGCSLLDRPEATDAYTPSDAQQEFVRTRDRTCRFPTCGQRVGWADADHVIPHAHGGPTDCANLCCLCRSHHRLKTFARGWRFHHGRRRHPHRHHPVRDHPHHSPTRRSTTATTRTRPPTGPGADSA
jgi:hypothetical protein